MNNSRLRPHALGLLILFALQFLSGMTLNLFVTLPTTHPGTTGSGYFTMSTSSLIWALSGQGGFALQIHALIALLLFFGSLALLVKSVRGRAKSWIWCSAVTTFFTLGALFNGLSFLDFNLDLSSMIMAICWLIAVAAIVFGLWLSFTRGKPVRAHR
jgi:hypothetical protein